MIPNQTVEIVKRIRLNIVHSFNFIVRTMNDERQMPL